MEKIVAFKEPSIHNTPADENLQEKNGKIDTSETDGATMTKHNWGTF